MTTLQNISISDMIRVEYEGGSDPSYEGIVEKVATTFVVVKVLGQDGLPKGYRTFKTEKIVKLDNLGKTVKDFGASYPMIG